MKTLRIPSLFCLLILANFHLHAQRTYLHAGLNFNKSSVKDLETRDRLSTGVNAGFSDFAFGAGFASKRIKNKVDIRAGLEWTVKGYRDKFTNHDWLQQNYATITTIESHKIRTRLNYISIPIVANYYFTVKNTKMFAQVGYFMARGLIGTEQLYGKYTNGDKIEKGILTEVFIVKERGMIRPDNGLILGYGVEFDEFQFGLQYQRSLKNIAKESLDIRNRSVCLHMVINLNLNH
jgi:hypothetical protein